MPELTPPKEVRKYKYTKTEVRTTVQVLRADLLKMAGVPEKQQRSANVHVMTECYSCSPSIEVNDHDNKLLVSWTEVTETEEEA